jgi:imidazolonepropionase
MRLNDERGVVEQSRALELTIKSGIVFDVDELLGDVREMVATTWPEGETPFHKTAEQTR